MDATIYVLSTNLHWYRTEHYKDITPEELVKLKAYQEEHQGQVDVVYS